jgi:hypothetical protein
LYLLNVTWPRCLWNWTLAPKQMYQTGLKLGCIYPNIFFNIIAQERWGDPHGFKKSRKIKDFTNQNLKFKKIRRCKKSCINNFVALREDLGTSFLKVNMQRFFFQRLIWKKNFSCLNCTANKVESFVFIFYLKLHLMSLYHTNFP